MLSIGNKKYRNLQEQVGYNTECIQELAETIDGITLEDKLVIIANDSGTFTEEEMTVLNGPLAFISDGSKVWLKQSETASEFVFKAIDIVATEQGGTHYNVGGSKIVVTRATRAYATSDDVIITTYSKSQIDSLLALKADLSGADFTGDITAPSITEINQGYSFTKPTDTQIEIVYAGVAKTGNKITMVIFGSFTPSSNIVADTSTLLGTFVLPQAVASKIYWYTSGSLTYVTAEGKIPLTYSVANSVDGQYYFRVGAQGEEVVRIYNKAQLNAGTTYHFRVEQTFLLSDNLAQ